jgi:hypothetical protein
MNIIYLRVSKEDESKQDPEQQLMEIKFKFKLSDYLVYEERGTAYDLNKIHKRQEFFKILRTCFDSDKVTIDDIFLKNIEKKEINIYVWDFARIIRNIELSIFFQLLSSWYDVKIYSYKDTSILKPVINETPTAKLTRIMMNTISAFSSEEYSYTISTNVKKSFQKISNSTYSKDGNKVGKKFINSAGFKVNISMKKENEMYQFIVDAIIECEKRKISGYYPLIIEKVKKMYDIVVSPAYLSNIKKRMGANNERN